MEMEIVEVAPTPTIRSAITVPRARATPTVTPRVNAPRAATTPSPAPRMATPRSDAGAAEVSSPRDPVVAHGVRCPLCRRPHALRLCGIFKAMQPLQRQQVAQAHGYCLNCLVLWHSTQECTSSGLCQICDRPHHTLLHRSSRRSAPAAPPPRNYVRPRSQPASASQTRHQRIQTHHWAGHRQPATTPRQRAWTHPGARYHEPAARYQQPPSRPRQRRPTGLSNVVETLQQLQRLLG